MDLKSIIEVNLPPLNEEEMKIIKQNYTQDFSTMTPKNDVLILNMLLPAQGLSLDEKLFMLLVRRLNMVVDFKANPELLI